MQEKKKFDFSLYEIIDPETESSIAKELVGEVRFGQAIDFYLRFWALLNWSSLCSKDKSRQEEIWETIDRYLPGFTDYFVGLVENSNKDRISIFEAMMFWHADRLSQEFENCYGGVMYNANRDPRRARIDASLFDKDGKPRENYKPPNFEAWLKSIQCQSLIVS